MVPSPYRCSSSSSITNEPHCNRIRRSHDTMHVRLKSRPSDSSSVVSTNVLIIVRERHIEVSQRLYLQCNFVYL